MICIDLMILMDSCRVGESGRIGERPPHTWFVLKYLLGYPNVRNYDGSLTEWRNLVRNPTEEANVKVPARLRTRR